MLNFANSSSAACLIKERNNNTIITDLYGGIPETLILNIIGWIIFVLLFSVLRQQAWDYGRLALVNSNGEKKRWTQIFYAHGNDPESGRNSVDTTPALSPTSSNSNTVTTTTTNTNYATDRGFFSWILVTLRLNKDQIRMHSGPDAVHYLSFQQHLMSVMAIIM